MSVPVLETPRLRMRAHTVGDFPALAAMWSDAAVIHHISKKPFRPDECWTRLLRYGGLWPLVGFGYWAVEEKSTGRYVGDVGFGDLYRVIEPPIHGVPEMGWVLGADFHGKGYGSEAVAAGLQWLEAQGRRRSVCIIDPDNEASLRLAAKYDFREACRTKLMGDEVILFERAL